MGKFHFHLSKTPSTAQAQLETKRKRRKKIKKLKQIKNERICFTTYDNYVNQSSFKHEKNSLLARARDEMSHLKIYYILMGNCATKEMFFRCLKSDAHVPRQQTSTELRLLVNSEQASDVEWLGSASSRRLTRRNKLMNKKFC